MSRVSDIYRPSLSTLTDLYELTMGAGYEAAGVADREAVFSLSFRSLPVSYTHLTLPTNREV